MARTFPAELTYQVARDPKLSAEVSFFNELRAQLGNDWLVFYSVAWISRFDRDGRLHDGEVDFVVAHPKHGILLIELKGGLINYDGSRSQWTTTDRNGDVHQIDPFKQVRKNKYALRDKILSLPGWKNAQIQLGHAVAFPRSVLSTSAQLPPDASADIIIDANDINRLPERLRQILSYWNAHQSADSSAGGGELIEALMNVIAPTTTLPNPLAVQIATEEHEIFTITADQFRLLDFMNRTRRAAISGAAGSGKTMMAVEKAQRLAREGFRTVLTCYNSALGEHLARACAATVSEVGGDNFFVGTFHGWCAHIAAKAGRMLPTANGKPAWEDYPDALVLALESTSDLKVDAIVVDEGQDLADMWWLALEASLHDRAESVFYVFYDEFPASHLLHPNDMRFFLINMIGVATGRQRQNNAYYI